MAIAAGKTNASRVQVGDRILVLVREDGSVTFSGTKTGTGVQVARVTGKSQGERVTSWGRPTNRMTYTIHTSAGDIRNLAPIQTMWLAPEDPAGIKRAHVEALKEDRERSDRAFLKAAAALATDPEVRAEAQALLDGVDPELVAMTTEELEDAHQSASEARDWDATERFRRELDRRRQAEKEALELERAPLEWDRDRIWERTTGVPAQKAVVELKVPTPAPSQDQLHAYASAVAIPRVSGETIHVTPMGSPRPGPEDLADLAQALVEEDLEHMDPEEVRVPKEGDLRCQPRDVVTIHWGDRLYVVERVEEDSSRSNITGEVTDHTLALVSPVDPKDRRDPQWVHVDLLHVRKPVARVYTEEITGRVRQTREVFATPDGSLRVIRTILMDSRRVPVATLVAPPLSLAAPVATLRVGEAIVVDGRCFAAELCESGVHLKLEPAPHRDRLRDLGRKYA